MQQPQTHGYRFGLVRQATLLVAVAACLNLCLVGVPAMADITPLPLINAGFETGDFTGWTTGSSIFGGAAPLVWYQSPYDSANKYLAVLAVGDMTGSGTAWVTQTVAMPTGDDVRWSFWVSAWGEMYHTGDIGMGFDGKIAGYDRTGTYVSLGLDMMYEYDWQKNAYGLVKILSPGWTITPALWIGDVITSDNLASHFAPDTLLTITYAESINYQGNSVFASVDDAEPVPLPASLILGGLGLVSLGAGGPLLMRLSRIMRRLA